MEKDRKEQIEWFLGLLNVDLSGTDMEQLRYLFSHMPDKVRPYVHPDLIHLQHALLDPDTADREFIKSRPALLSLKRRLQQFLGGLKKSLERIQEYQAKTDNLLAGMNAGDYAVFSQDFDQDMLSAMTETEFDKLKADRDLKLGLYVSREVDSVVQTGDFYAVIYDAKFEKDGAVTMRVVFRIAEPHEISGLWFNK